MRDQIKESRYKGGTRDCQLNGDVKNNREKNAALD